MHGRLRVEYPLLMIIAGWGLGCGEGPPDTFPPEGQTPFFEKGRILPPDSLPCTPASTGIPQTECNHHGSTIAELPDGSVAVVWFHGEAEKSPDSRIVWSRLPTGAEAWTEPEVLFDDPNRSEGNAALWVHEDGTLYLFFVSIFGEGWDQARPRLIRSVDGGRSWTDPVTLREEYCLMARHRPLRLQSGGMLLPLYHECLALPVFMFSSDDFRQRFEERTFDIGEYIVDHVSHIQPALIQRADGTLVAITRDGGLNKRIHSMESTDDGITWTPSAPTELPNDGTSVDWTRLLDDHVAVVFNNTTEGRFPLSAALSVDEGRTFTAVRTLSDECPVQSPCSLSYPSILQSRRDGTLWVSFTDDRHTIGWAHFNEAWLRQGNEPINNQPLP